MQDVYAGWETAQKGGGILDGKAVFYIHVSRWKGPDDGWNS